eukprot:3650789-Ditylum_brightwellii.AAC.2
MAQMYTTSGNINIALIIKNLQHRKEVQTAFSLLQFAAKGEVAGSVSTIKYLSQSNLILQCILKLYPH